MMDTVTWLRMRFTQTSIDWYTTAADEIENLRKLSDVCMSNEWEWMARARVLENRLWFSIFSNILACGTLLWKVFA